MISGSMIVLSFIMLKTKVLEFTMCLHIIMNIFYTSNEITEIVVGIN